MLKIRPKSVFIPVSSTIADSDTAGDAFITGSLYGRNPKAVIFSNMDTNCPDDWAPVVSELFRCGHMILTYNYYRTDRARTDDLRDAVAFIRTKGAEKIILIGASRGGVSAISVASDPNINYGIIAIAAISAPRVYEGTLFYSTEELRAIKVPKLLISSENEDWANDTHEMYKIFNEPKDMQFYQGNAHGTEIFLQHQEAMTERLVNFVTAGFSA